jgi:pimeloyl-ACP methyl ester carboxylesterase
MAAGARRRRAAFASRDDALAHFAARPLFARFHPDALAGYVRDGLVPYPDPDPGSDDGPVVLACSPETEALTFTHATDHDVLEHLAEIGCPTTLAYGDLPDAFGPILGGEVHRRMPQATLEIAHGLGHLGPCDDPTRVAGAVVAALAGS